MGITWETIESYDLAGVRRLIMNVSDREGLSLFDMAKRAGLSHTTLWAILYRKNRKEGNTVHRSTIKKLGDGLGYQVLFFSAEGTVRFSKQFNSHSINTDRQLEFDENELESPPPEPVGRDAYKGLF